MAKHYDLSDLSDRSTETRLRRELTKRVYRIDFAERAHGWTVADVYAYACESLGVATALAYLSGDTEECQEWKRRIRVALHEGTRRLGGKPKALPVSVNPNPPRE